MEKFISKFNISSQVTKGTTKQRVICPKCNQQNIISTKNKFMLSKINTVNCIKCHQSIVIGDIFNLKTGSKLKLFEIVCTCIILSSFYEYPFTIHSLTLNFAPKPCAICSHNSRFRRFPL